MATSRGEKSNPSVRPSRATKAQMAEHEFRLMENKKFEPTTYDVDRDLDFESSDARITMQLKFMAEQIGELSAIVYELEERITPILLPPMAEPSDPGAPASESSEVSRVIDDHNSSLREIQRRIMAIIRRVQL